ncbi:hypothetical protein [Paenibacillus alkalitolerans]|uniref:hypothetical protein n=1 Tax=Paenibacillus alkalitolerans TaxID=2799335 RepID=UPI0018F5A5B2|nr:hypothetical protein [Paenibacillus alkalitolerans]
MVWSGNQYVAIIGAVSVGGCSASAILADDSDVNVADAVAEAFAITFFANADHLYFSRKNNRLTRFFTRFFPGAH